MNKSELKQLIREVVQENTNTKISVGDTVKIRSNLPPAYSTPNTQGLHGKVVKVYPDGWSVVKFFYNGKTVDAPFPNNQLEHWF